MGSNVSGLFRFHLLFFAIYFLSQQGALFAAGIYYKYDAAGRLAGVVYTFDRSIAFGYDAADNMAQRDLRGPTLAQPTLTGKPNPSQTSSPKPTLQWNPSPGAASYRLELATDEAFSHVISSTVVSGASSLTLPQALPASGRYYWRVRAENGTFISSWTVATFLYVLTRPSSWLLLLQ